MAKTSEAMKKAIDKYQKERVDELKIRVPKGQKLKIQEFASTQGESLNSFVNKSIFEKMERDQQKKE